MSTFRFEGLECGVKWPRVCATNVRRLEMTQDYEGVLSFLAEVALGKADDGFLDVKRPQLKALQLLQLSSQYLLHSQQCLLSQRQTMDLGLKRLGKRAEKCKLENLAKRSELKLLLEERQRQNDVLATYHTLLQSLDPKLAASLAKDKKTGRVFCLKNESLRDDDSDSDSDSSLASIPERNLTIPAKPMRLLLRSSKKESVVFAEEDDNSHQERPGSPMKRLKGV